MRYSDVSDELKEVFNEILTKKTAIPTFVKFRLVNDNKSKKAMYCKKQTDINKFITDKDIIVICNEDIIALFDEKQVEIIIREALSCIVYDSDADKLMFQSEDFSSYKSIIKLYSFDSVNQIKESIEAFVKQKEEKEKEEKANKKLKNRFK